MKLLLDAFWRAVAYCLHPKVIGLSLLPLLIGAALALGLGWLYWEPAVAAVRGLLESWSLVDAALKWVESVAGASFRSVLAPLMVVLAVAPVIVVVSVLLVAWLMTPALVRLVADRRFPQLERKRGGGVLGSAWRSFGSTVVALIALVASLPLWFIPPLVLVLPPLIWGWLAYRVMSYDALSEHASREERQVLQRRHGLSMLAIGVISGYLGAAPSLLWAVGAVALIFAPFVIALSVWLYTLVFAFSALWFTHFGLAALDQLRREAGAAAEAAAAAARGGADVVDVPSVTADPPAARLVSQEPPWSPPSSSPPPPMPPEPSA